MANGSTGLFNNNNSAAAAGADIDPLLMTAGSILGIPAPQANGGPTTIGMTGGKKIIEQVNEESSEKE